MSRDEKAPSAKEAKENIPAARTPGEAGELKTATGKKKDSKKDADFTPRTVFGDVAI